MTTVEGNETPAPKTYPERRCSTGNHMFKPTNGTDRSCPECYAAGQVGRRVRLPVVDSSAERVIAPWELLELAGFKVRVMHTPSGVIMQVE